MPLAERIKEARENAGLTQRQLAELLHVSRGSIANYESGLSAPNEPILIQLMQILNVDANTLYQDYEIPTVEEKKNFLFETVTEKPLINTLVGMAAQMDNKEISLLIEIAQYLMPAKQ